MYKVKRFSEDSNHIQHLRNINKAQKKIGRSVLPALGGVFGYYAPVGGGSVKSKALKTAAGVGLGFLARPTVDWQLDSELNDKINKYNNSSKAGKRALRESLEKDLKKDTPVNYLALRMAKKDRRHV